ncbi:hypothetical protein Tco_1369202, partial [Tanacetum coccineum]
MDFCLKSGSLGILVYLCLKRREHVMLTFHEDVCYAFNARATISITNIRADLLQGLTRYLFYPRLL